ncbi:GNAT family N-acetyltransferase [Eggerthia catenaformis]|uniref:GNAT family N-acetyltransferase n=1 Tax=Eggerthia catenaformis TaxID=31973 RepID=UPI00248DC60D|nr:GNAT family N-acetyltransferase [Eggerthia catenaformis]
MKLYLLEYIDKNLPRDFTPYSIYEIEVDSMIIGSLVFREGTDQMHYYDGHIGYTIEKDYQGHYYAYQACLLLKDILIKKGYNHVIITCDPENKASIKTIERLEAQYLETADIPIRLRHVFTEHEKVKRIYRWELR